MLYYCTGLELVPESFWGVVSFKSKSNLPMIDLHLARLLEGRPFTGTSESKQSLWRARKWRRGPKTRAPQGCMRVSGQRTHGRSSQGGAGPVAPSGRCVSQKATWLLVSRAGGQPKRSFSRVPTLLATAAQITPLRAMHTHTLLPLEKERRPPTPTTARPPSRRDPSAHRRANTRDTCSFLNGSTSRKQSRAK